MIPTPAIEHLFSLMTPDGERLVTQGATQIIIPAFPPNTTWSFSAGPLGSDYGQIVYGVRLGVDMVPNAFTGYIQMFGTRIIEGIHTATVLATEVQGFAWVTQSQEAVGYLTNVSGLNQLLEIYFASLRIANEADYHAVIEELKHMATSIRAEQLAVEANQLLKMLTGQPPEPQPPIGGKR